MPFHKRFTSEDKFKHRIIKIAEVEGLTGVVVVWNHAMSYARGWHLTCDQNIIVRAYSIDVLIERMHKEIERLKQK